MNLIVTFPVFFFVNIAAETTFFPESHPLTLNSLLYADALIPADHDLVISPRLSRGVAADHVTNSIRATVNRFDNLFSNSTLLAHIYTSHQNTYYPANQDKPLEFSKNVNPSGWASPATLSRLAIFKHNLLSIASHNLEVMTGHHTYTRGVNAFTHLSPSEFHSVYSMSSPHPNSANSTLRARGARGSSDQCSKGVRSPTPPLDGMPDSFDWRNNNGINYVTSVKWQHQCNSCYAFASVGCLESAILIGHGGDQEYNFDLSEQDVVDCSNKKKYGENDGCKSGFAQPSFNYITDRGISFEQDYPYVARKASFYEKCKSDVSPRQYCEVSYQLLNRDDEGALANAVWQNGPATVIVNSNHWSDYKKGVFDNCDQGTQNGYNHVVLVVGYTPNYFIIKNSWNEKWGLGGYMHLKRGRNYCCVSTYAVGITGLANC